MEVNKVKRFDPWTDMWGVFCGMNQKATGDWVDYDDYAKLEATIAELTRERDELREASRWIPVSERLPEVGVAVLCWDSVEEEMVQDELYQKSPSDGGGVQFVKRYIHNYSHWQSLPKAPL